MPNWEYHVVSFEAGEDTFNAVTIKTILNQLGSEHWKIAAITPLLGGSSAAGQSGPAGTRAVMVTLKRKQSRKRDA